MKGISRRCLQKGVHITVPQDAFKHGPFQRRGYERLSSNYCVIATSCYIKENSASDGGPCSSGDAPGNAEMSLPSDDDDSDAADTNSSESDS